MRPACSSAHFASPSEVFAQVHTRVQVGNLFGVAVEWQGLAAAQLTDSAFGCLAPAWMVHLWIDVGIEPVLTRVGDLPGISRLLGGEVDLDDGLHAFEAVLPWHDQAQWCAILVRQHPAV